MYNDHLHCQIDRDLSFNPILVEERTTFIRILKKIGEQNPTRPCQRGLDIGTVTGFYPAFFAFAGMQSYALNISKDALAYAHEKSSHLLQDSGAIEADIRTLPFSDRTIDIVTVMTGTFSHLQPGTHQQALDEIYQRH